jgi:transposase-like protein
MTTRKSYTPEQVVRKLAEADKLIAEGATAESAARQIGVAGATYYRWRNQFNGMKVSDVKRLKELEIENGRLKRLLVDAELEKDMLKELAQGKF